MDSPEDSNVVVCVECGSTLQRDRSEEGRRFSGIAVRPCRTCAAKQQYLNEFLKQWTETAGEPVVVTIGDNAAIRRGTIRVRVVGCSSLISHEVYLQKKLCEDAAWDVVAQFLYRICLMVKRDREALGFPAGDE
jgi:hypothetical protein